MLKWNLLSWRWTALALPTECQYFPNYFNKWSEFCQEMWKYMPWGFLGFISEMINLRLFSWERTPSLIKKSHESLIGFQRVLSLIVLTTLILIDLVGFFQSIRTFLAKNLVLYLNAVSSNCWNNNCRL